MDRFDLYQGDCLDVMRGMGSQSVHCVVTSPPYYGLRDYGMDGQIGLEETPEAYVARLVEVFREVRRVLRDDGTVWLNLGDSYAGSGKGPAGNLGKMHNEREMTHTTASGNVPDGLKPKDLIGIPWRVAFALQADGWWLRQDIIWHKPNPMPESVTDRCTKAHEYVFLLSKSARYYYDHEAVKEPAVRVGDVQTFGGAKARNGEIMPHDPRYRNGSEQWGRVHEQASTRNRRSVWTVATKPYSGAHFAVFPPDLIEPCVLAGCPEGGVTLDPFNGSGTTGEVAVKHGRRYVGIELNPDYLQLAEERLSKAEALWLNRNDVFVATPDEKRMAMVSLFDWDTGEQDE